MMVEYFKRFLGGFNRYNELVGNEIYMNDEHNVIIDKPNKHIYKEKING